MKVLALVNAHALAHVSRALEVAKALRKRGHEVMLAGHGQYLPVADADGFESEEIPFIPIEQVVESIRSQKLGNLFQKEQLTEYLDADLDLFERYGPDLLLIDNRLTASTAAELAGIPSVSILNVHMSLYKAIPFYSVRNFLKRDSGALVAVLDGIQNRIEATFYDKIVMKGMNQLRSERGLAKKPGYTLEEGDLTLFPDLPEFSPVRNKPPSTHYIGPLTWHNDLPAPSCLGQLDPQKKCIYFTIGSAGLESLIEQVGIFADQQVQIVIATGQLNEALDVKLPENVFVEQYVNTELLLPHCDLVVCHGGNGTIYQALSHGLPIVGLATHEEQYYGLKRVNQLQLGIGYSRKEVQEHGLPLVLGAVKEILDDGVFRTNAETFRKMIAKWNAPMFAADLIETFCRDRGCI